MIVKNINTHAHGDVYLVVLAHFAKVVEMGLGFNAFWEVETLFSERPDAMVEPTGR
jgi:hypothetical protein